MADPNYEQQINEMIEANNMIAAIKLYREMTGAGLAEAKQVIETMARGEVVKPFSEMQQFDEPIMEGKIRSLLARSQKIEAIKIYREEHGVSLKEAKDYVDQIDYSMRRENQSGGLPYESAIGSDPFAVEDGNRRRMIVLAVGVLILLCGVGIFFLLINP